MPCKEFLHVKKPGKSQTNFLTPTKRGKSHISGIWPSKSQSGHPAALGAEQPPRAAALSAARGRPRRRLLFLGADPRWGLLAGCKREPGASGWGPGARESAARAPPAQRSTEASRKSGDCLRLGLIWRLLQTALLRVRCRRPGSRAKSDEQRPTDRPSPMQKAFLAPCQLLSRFVRMNASAQAARSLADKVALVTASTEGIGFAIARRLAQDGAHVLVSSRKQANVDRAVAELRGENLSVSGLVCHVGNAEQRQRLVDAALERHGGIDILVSNAAVNPFFGSMLEATESVWDKILDINVKSTALLVNLVVPHMEKRGSGSIVIVASLAGYMPFPALGPYNVSKTALLGLTRNLATELASRNIRVNCLAPGLIRTKFSSALWQDETTESKMLESLRIRRIGLPSDCSGIVSFLCSADADYITGETVVVAGGALSHL